jgi:hypothetical protein
LEIEPTVLISLQLMFWKASGEGSKHHAILRSRCRRGPQEIVEMAFMLKTSSLVTEERNTKRNGYCASEYRAAPWPDIVIFQNYFFNAT